MDNKHRQELLHFLSALSVIEYSDGSDQVAHLLDSLIISLSIGEITPAEAAVKYMDAILEWRKA